MQMVSLPSPLSINNHTQAAASCQYYDSHLAYYYSNQMNNYEMNPSSLVLDASTAYKWQEQQEETYSKQQLSMLSNDIKPENCSLMTEGNLVVDTVGANEFSSQIDRTHPIHSNNMLMDGQLWCSEPSASPSTLTDEELIPSPTSSTSRISPNHYSWQLENMSRQDLIKRLIHLETERALQETMNHKSESNDMSYPMAVSKQETYREVSRESLDRHNSVEYDQNVKVCLWQGCNESFDSLDLLIAHVRNIHIGRGKPSYPCLWQDCRMQVNHPFAKRHKLLSHMRTHTGEKPFKCSSKGCNKSFSRPDSLDIHVKTHSNIRPFSCNFEGCTKAYYHARSLKKHEKIHLKAMVDNATPHVVQPETHPSQRTSVAQMYKSDNQQHGLLESQNCLSYGALWQPMLSYLYFADRPQQNNSFYM
ncbi:hypothetical protein K450DRAFT_226651 [Umbelopsis ramanniana AG]|uniref:C2H2-type domain-containing protein n=1 Tax=Umbelopsis ramanniana AG TaxID=1314678 RepID=A0AAD5HFS7_UMBRA|nr:uncharacterized protein K450DRAFT_226651 [Umbelopsis ramanniana AG]KAI8582735.1 hypothetical protein K450DRAFT_226651 [Umbelopsis ramanniana AG]